MSIFKIVFNQRISAQIKKNSNLHVLYVLEKSDGGVLNFSWGWEFSKEKNKSVWKRVSFLFALF